MTKIGFKLEAEGSAQAAGNVQKLVDEVTKLDTEIEGLNKSMRELKKEGKMEEFTIAKRKVDDLKYSKQQLNKQIRDNRKELELQKKGLDDMINKFRVGGVSVGEFKTVLKNTTTGLQISSKAVFANVTALKAFKIALAATGVGLIVIALGTLVTYLTKTQKGMDFVSKVAGAASAVFSKFIERVAKLGAGLFKVLTLDFSGFTDMADSIQGFGSDMIDAAKGGYQLAGSMQAIRDEEIGLTVILAERRKAMAKAKLDSENVTLGLEKQIEASKLGLDIAKQIEDIETRFLDKKIKALQELHAQGITNAADESELAALIAERENKQAQNTERQTELQNKLNTSTKAAADAVKEYTEGSLTDLETKLTAIQKKIDGGDLSEKTFLEKKDLVKKIKDTEKALKELEYSFKTLDELIAEANKDQSPDFIPVQEVSFDEFKKQREAEMKERLERDREYLDKKTEQEQAQIEWRVNFDKEREKQAQADKLAIQQGFLESTQNILGAISGAVDASTARQLAGVERRYAREIKLAEGNKSLQASLQQKLDAEKEKIERKEFERKKSLEIASAGVQYAQGILNVWAAPSTIPDPFGKIFKAVQVGVLSGIFASQVSAIRSKTFATGGVRDGILSGPSHAQGGILVGHDEMEGGEAIINKHSTAKFRPLLSAINSYNNYGKKFQSGGIRAGNNIPSFVGVNAAQGVSLSPLSATASIADESIAAMAGALGSAVRQGIGAGLQDAHRMNERENVYQRTSRV